MIKLIDKLFKSKIRFEFLLDGISRELEVEFSSFKKDAYITLDGCVHHSFKQKPMFLWRNIPFSIGEHSCNLIVHYSDKLLDAETDYQYDLIIDGYSVSSGEAYNLKEEKKKNAKMYYMDVLRLGLAAMPVVLVCGFISGYFLSELQDSMVKNILKNLILAIGFYIAKRIYDYFKNIRCNNF
jgi:hypothetical protein